MTSDKQDFNSPMPSERARLKAHAAVWHEKARRARAQYNAQHDNDVPSAESYQGARFSSVLSASAIFSACAEAANAFEKAANGAGVASFADATSVARYMSARRVAEKARNRAMAIEHAVNTAKLAAAKSEAAIAEEVEAVWRIRETFCGKDSRQSLRDV
jgi:hypothetical protein